MTKLVKSPAERNLYLKKRRAKNPFVVLNQCQGRDSNQPLTPDLNTQNTEPKNETNEETFEAFTGD